MGVQDHCRQSAPSQDCNFGVRQGVSARLQMTHHNASALCWPAYVQTLVRLLCRVTNVPPSCWGVLRQRLHIRLLEDLCPSCSQQSVLKIRTPCNISAESVYLMLASVQVEVPHLDAAGGERVIAHLHTHTVQVTVSGNECRWGTDFDASKDAASTLCLPTPEQQP